MSWTVWHKCHLCDCEFYDTELEGYWGYCPSCRKVEADRRSISAKPSEAKASPAKKSN